MKAKASKSSRNRVRPKPRQVQEEKVERSQRKKGWFFAMKAKLATFYMDKVQPKLRSARARLTRFKLWMTGRLTTAKASVTEAKRQGIAWLARHERCLWLAALAIIFLMIGAGLAILWQRSPTLRDTVKTLGVAVLSGLITLGALLKGLGQSLAGLSSGLLNVLRLAWSRLTRPVIKVIVVTRPTGETVPAPPIDGRL